MLDDRTTGIGVVMMTEQSRSGAECPPNLMTGLSFGTERPVALVTGSSRGVGRAIALALARGGADVAVHCHDSREEGARVVQEIRGLGRRSVLVMGNVLQPDEVKEVCQRVSVELGTVSVLVNNAVYALQKCFLDIEPAEWLEQLHYKGFGYYLFCRELLPGMVRQRSGVIINVLSTVALRGGEGESGYAASNGAALSLTRALANEFGPAGIRCCALMLAWAENAFDASDPECARHIERFPLGRVTRLEEVAQAAVFLASSQAAAVTGTALVVDAGYLSKW